MESQAYFTGIREKIIEHLHAATDSVLVAVAWLTDRALFDALVGCQRRGVAVSLAVLDDRLNRKAPIVRTSLSCFGDVLSMNLCAIRLPSKPTQNTTALTPHTES